ncbi:LacI family DNA-binding transcriptional regulator [Streptococcus porcorum]|uniref:LacI family transcriptional regulator n=1 Tax=Streptococcus porcorum TaxID=701526 RepID=A0ABV2JD51_9STRE
MVTIKDVAERAGVNPSTVSRALKDSSAISQKTKDRVKKAMDELGYVPNVAAKMLASGLTRSVGVILPPLTKDRVAQPFFMEILTVINNEAKKRSFTVSIATASTVEELTEHVELMYKQRRVDGFIVLYSQKDDPVREYLTAQNIPFVVVGEPEELGNEITYIDNDNQLMGRTAVDVLIENGHDKILFVTDDLNSQVFSERYLGYQIEMTKRGLVAEYPILFDKEDALSLDAFKSLLDKTEATALVVVDDMLSVRVIQFLSFYDINVPHDVSIVSFNNSSYAKIIHPYLTTFDINIPQLGKASLARLLDKLDVSKDENEKVIVPFTLKKRESVRNLKK